MHDKNRTRIYLTIGAVILSIFLIYRFGFSDRFYNISNQSTTLELQNSGKTILIEKHPQQREIKYIELRVRGKLSDNITIYLSEDGRQAISSIRIKKGKVDIPYRSAWNKDLAYIIIENPNESNSTLELEYQFLTN